ncbi:hypothetical protein [Streptomyces phaeoluteigriseus]
MTKTTARPCSGATAAGAKAQDHVRVLHDLADDPFCLWTRPVSDA